MSKMIYCPCGTLNIHTNKYCWKCKQLLKDKKWNG